MKIFRNRTVIGVLCILLALIICFGVTPLFSRSASEKTEIVRVTMDIKEGDEITAEMVQTVEVGAYNLPQNLMTDKKEVVGKYATADLAAGDYILSNKLSAVPAAENAYDEGRLWNKNMVARILADTRYTGEKGYPKLIDEKQLIAANEKRSNKPQLPKKTEAQKVLRRLCGTPPSERVEQSVTDLLNGLANCPDRIRHQRSPTPATHSKTQETLDNALEQQPIDEDNAKALILQLAAEQYAALGDEEYETNRLRCLFSAFECAAELNADLLKSTVSEVQVTRQNVKLRLKNGQVIERSDLQ